MDMQAPQVVHHMPKLLLVSITDLIEWISEKSDGLITIPEVADAITHIYDGDSMPLFDGGCYGLADEMGPLGDEVEAYNYRGDTICDIFNSRYWKIPDAMIRSIPVRDIMIRKADGQIIAKILWARFFPDSDFVGDVSSIAGFKLTTAQLENSASATVFDPVSNGKKGLEARHENMRKLKAWSIEKYKARKWTSANEAASILADEVVNHGRTIGACLKKSNAQRTIAEWFRKSV